MTFSYLPFSYLLIFLAAAIVVADMPPAWITQAIAGNCCLPIVALEDGQVNIQREAPQMVDSQSYPSQKVSPPKGRNKPLPPLPLPPPRKRPLKKLQKPNTCLLQSIDRAVLPNFLPRDQYHKIITIRRPPYNKNYVPVVSRFALDNERSYIASKVLGYLGNERITRKIVCACPYNNCPHRSPKRHIPGSKSEDKTQRKVVMEEVEDMGNVTLEWTEDEPNEVTRKMQKWEREEKRMKRIADLKQMLSLKKSPEAKAKKKGMDIKGKGVDRDEIELQPIEYTTGRIKIEPRQKATVTVGDSQLRDEAEIWYRGIFYVVEGSEVEPGIEVVLNRDHTAKIQGLFGLEVESTTGVKQEVVDPKTGEVTEVINDFIVDGNITLLTWHSRTHSKRLG